MYRNLVMPCWIGTIIGILFYMGMKNQCACVNVRDLVVIIMRVRSSVQKFDASL